MIPRIAFENEESLLAQAEAHQHLGNLLTSLASMVKAEDEGVFLEEEYTEARNDVLRAIEQWEKVISRYGTERLRRGVEYGKQKRRQATA